MGIEWFGQLKGKGEGIEVQSLGFQGEAKLSTNGQHNFTHNKLAKYMRQPPYLQAIWDVNHKLMLNEM